MKRATRGWAKPYLLSRLQTAVQTEVAYDAPELRYPNLPGVPPSQAKVPDGTVLDFALGDALISAFTTTQALRTDQSPELSFRHNALLWSALVCEEFI